MLSGLENVQMAAIVASRNGRKVTVSRVSEDKIFLAGALAIGQHFCTYTRTCQSRVSISITNYSSKRP